MSPNKPKPFRYRRLTSTRNVNAVAESKGTFSGRGMVAVDMLVAEASAVRDVYAEEDSGSVEDLSRRLRDGELMPSDLVECDGRWSTFAESPDFFEVCEGLVDRRQLGYTLKAVGLAVLAFVAFGLILWGRLSRL
ncbi:MAG: hypothetical protein WBV82_18655 [Myxococcaceae bacterium]